MVNVQRSLTDAQVASQTGGVRRERDLQRRTSGRRGSSHAGNKAPQQAWRMPGLVLRAASGFEDVLRGPCKLQGGGEHTAEGEQGRTGK